MAELADALDLGSSVPDVQVQVLSSALYESSFACNGRERAFSSFAGKVLTMNEKKREHLDRQTNLLMY